MKYLAISVLCLLVGSLGVNALAQAPAGDAPPRVPFSRPAPPAPAADPEGWVKVLESYDYYRTLPGKEEIVSGTLDELPSAAGTASKPAIIFTIGGVGIRMRHPELRPFVGKAVEIRGKVQASATDPLGRDIEPGAIRLDPSAVQPATPAAATQGSQPASASSQSTTSATSTATATSQAAGEWKNIYGELGWYKNQKDEEKVYEGTLEAVVREGPAKEPMAVRAFYKLGDRAIYVGPKRSPLLEKMIGKKVEIRGKLQEIMVDSTPIKEIWPGAVREQP